MMPLPQLYPHAHCSSDASDLQWYSELEILDINDMCTKVESLCKARSCHAVGSPNLKHAISASRNLSSLFGEAFLRERGKVNPFECLGKGPRRDPFINRSAMKMVNIDYIFDIVNRYSQHTGYFSFVDLCGGPGGFSEYLLTRCSALQLRATGFAMSLGIDPTDPAASCNWKLAHVHQPPYISIGISSLTDKGRDVEDESDVQFTIVTGADGSGNIYNPENISVLSSTVLNQTQTSIRKKAKANGQQQQQQYDLGECGVDFVCGDGGTGEGRDKEDQEVLMLPLLAAQVVAMLRTLRTGGSFLLKGFSMHTVSTQIYQTSDYVNMILRVFRMGPWQLPLC
jgi:23S rRNA U2552 (ribose-2'-O)-methylase RlmE/FtsJ